MAQRRIFQASREEVSDLPVRGLSPANVVGGQYRVAVQQAPESGYTKLARSLSNVSAGLQAYASVADIQRQEGERQGQIDAAKADLELAQQELDVAGQKLVDQGLMPKSHLLGYQRAYQENIGKRFVRSYMTNVNNRWNDVIDPEADDSVIDKILAEEREKVIQNFNKSPTALLGFTKNADAFDYQYVNKAVTARDKSVRQHNKSLIVEDLNNQYSAQMQDKEVPPTVTAQAIKDSVDQLIEAGSIDKSEAVEVIWNSVAMPTVLAIASDNPDRAEQVLDAFLDIDLTGKGGRLGNINREGAWVKSRAVELRNRIDTERERIERDSPEKSEEIIRNWLSASDAVYTGYDGEIPMVDPFAGSAPDVENFDDELRFKVTEITRALVASGMQLDEAQSEALLLIKTRDTDRLYARLQEGYVSSESTRGAFLDSVSDMQLSLRRKVESESLVLSREEGIALVNEYRNVKELNPDITATQYASANGILDRRVREELRQVELQYDVENWYTNTPEHAVRVKSVESSLVSTLSEIIEEGDIDLGYSTYTERKRIYLSDDLIAQYEKEYEDKMREASKLAPNQDEFKTGADGQQKHNEILRDFKARYIESVKDQVALETTREEEFGERFDAPTSLTKEQLERQKKFNNAAKTLFTEKFVERESLGYFDPGSIGARSTDLGVLRQQFTQTPTRAKALPYINALEKLRGTDKITKEIATLYKDHINDLRGIYGYEDISQVPEDSGLPLSIPYWSNKDALRSYMNDLKEEFALYEQANENVRGIANYPKLNELLRKLSIPPKEQILGQFITTQFSLMGD